MADETATKQTYTVKISDEQTNYEPDDDDVVSTSVMLKSVSLDDDIDLEKSIVTLEKSAMADETATKKTYTVKTADGKTYELDDDVVSPCVMLKSVFLDNDMGLEKSVVTLANVDSEHLEKVIEYCKRHSPGAKAKGKSTEEWDEEFIGEDTNALYYFILAVNYLEHKELLSKICKKVAKIMSGKTPEQIRERFNVKNDFTPEERAIREKYYWAFDHLGKESKETS